MMCSTYVSYRLSILLVLISILLIVNLKTTLCEKTEIIHPFPCSNVSLMNDSHAPSNQTFLNFALMALSDDTTLELEEGEHCIWNYWLISELTNVTIRSNSASDTIIRCTRGNGIVFFNVDELTIEGVTVLQCGLEKSDIKKFTHNVTSTVDYFFRVSESPDNHIAMACGNCSNFILRNSLITNTSGLGFLGINLVGNSRIENTSFANNAPEGCFHLAVDDIYQEEKTGGGALIVYHDSQDKELHAIEDSHLHVENSLFYNNSYCGIQGVYELYSHFSEEFFSGHFYLGGGGGLTVVLTQIHYNVNVTVENSTFLNNTAQYGGGANIEIFTAVFDSHVSFKDCNFTKNGLDNYLVLDIDYITGGSGLAFISDILQPTFSHKDGIIPRSQQVPCTFSITGSNFNENRGFSGGAILIISLYAPLLGGTLQKQLHIESCHFEMNFGVIGSAVYALEWKKSPAQPGLDIFFHDVTFDGNIVYSLSDISSATQNSAVIEVVTLNVTFSGNNVIANSDGTGFRATGSVLYLTDNITFCNNRGSYGGAMRLETGSIMILRNHTRVHFKNNTGAVYGGAIYINYVDALPSLSQVDCSIYFGHFNLLCFSSVHSSCTDITKHNITVEFEGNSAPLGSMVYGTTLETCPWVGVLKENYAPPDNFSIFEIFEESLWEHDNFTSPFIFDQPPNNSIQVSTRTGRIILSQSEISAVPGGTITLGIQTLDKFNRSVPTILTSVPSSVAKSQNVSTLLGRSTYLLLQQSKDPNNLTMEANFTVFGDENINNVSVSFFSLISLTQSDIAVSVTNCSEGFTYVDSSHSCECSDLFKHSNIHIDCNSKDFTLVVPQDVWVGPGPDGELVITSCHFDYCLGGKRTIHPPDFDTQCQDNYNRSGIVCGQCMEGYSVVFGSNRCLECSNINIMMIIVFALMGIALISAISFLQITISEGYLNGVLFYANVLNLYLPLLTKSGSNIIHIFFLVSLLNLNLGFECCFYNGMNALARSGLNLVFPFYIFSLMLIIILGAKWSNRFSNWFTRNGFSASKVFVTLIVMSYSSLLETCVQILGFDRISSVKGDHYQWRIDNNQQYFRGNHAFLGILAIILLIILLPLPFLMLFEGKVFKFRIFQRYKPLYDAVWAPFKPRFRFWVGLRLILRGFPFIFVYFFDHPLNILFLATFLVSLLWIQGMLRPFRGFARNAFDTFFLADLLIVVLLALYFYTYLAQFEIVDDSKQDEIFHVYQVVFYSFVVSVAYIGILLILLWHLALRFPRLMKLLNYVLNRSKKTASIISERKLVTFAGSKSKQTSHSEYGSINSEGATPSEQSSDEGEGYNSDNVVHERKAAVVTYTQWREPLLESGSLEVETIDNERA